MRITLVNPPFVYTEYDRETEGPLSRESGQDTYSIGLAALGGVLRQHGHEVSGLDMPYFTYDESLERLTRSRPDVVGMSCWTGTHQILLRLAADLKKRLPETRVVFGGHHATMFWNQLLNCYPQVDAVVLGEGEENFPVLVKNWETDGWPEESGGLAYRRDGEIHFTGSAVRLLNLDRYPMPAFDLFQRARSVGREARDGARVWPGKEYRAQVLAARGCPFQCTFCVDGKFYTQTASRSAANVVDEIEILNREYNVGFFEFTDMTFTLSQKRTVALCEEILNRGLQISWQAMTRVNAISPEVLQAMKDAGCYSVSFGVETGSAELLKRIKKAITREEIIDAFHTTQAAGLSTTMLLMSGNPGETEETIEETIDLIYQARPTQIDPNMYQVYPGSQTYNELRASGYISDDYWLDHAAAPYYIGEHPIEKLQYWQRKITFHHNTYSREIPKKVLRWLKGLVRHA